MNKVEYQQYLRSNEWKEIRNRLLQSKCSICGNNRNLQLHHLKYCDIKDDDFVTLCKWCHKKIHTNKKGLLEPFVNKDIQLRRLAYFKNVLKNQKTKPKTKKRKKYNFSCEAYRKPKPYKKNW